MIRTDIANAITKPAVEHYHHQLDQPWLAEQEFPLVFRRTFRLRWK